MLTLYNTLTKRKEPFVPLHPGKVGMYICGPTVYAPLHLGNIRAYVFADTLRRVLEDAGYEVRMIKNITDVGHMTTDDIGQGDQGEDKIVKQARAQKKTPEEIAAFFEGHFHQAETALGILPAHYFPRATAHIKEMIRLIETLIARGHAYEKNGHVFLDVTTFPRYGRLSGNTLEKLQVGTRLEPHPAKRHPWDFALWLKAPAGHLMQWSSPWSTGYPGWHIECSAMSMEYLGDTFDIHTGGEDNIFPHHEAEIVQSEGATGKPFVRYFLHTRHMLVNGEKMSKSQGNFSTLEDLTARGYSPTDIRILFASTHHRKQMNFTEVALQQAKKNKEMLLGAQLRLAETPDTAKHDEAFTAAEHLRRFRDALSDDLNTPQGLAIALECAKQINTLTANHVPLHRQSVQAAMDKMLSLLGIISDRQTIPQEVEALARKRETVRTAKNFIESDRLRDAIERLGYNIEDGPTGYRLKKS